MHIPTSPQTPEEFTARIAEALDRADTHIYMDTSFLMWLTKGGPETRCQFREWADGLGGRVHVPLWTKHEYYRHHAEGTLKSRLNRRSDELIAALKTFREEVSLFYDNALLGGRAETAFPEAVQDVEERLSAVTDAAKSWDYEAAAGEIIGWMNERMMATARAFDSMASLGAVGALRYSHDVPPGYLDRGKKDRPKRGGNRYGDLLFWQEIMEHAASCKARSVVIMTRDRKSDWFMKSRIPEVEGEWKRLRGKWQPVPHPHPTLAFEMKVACNSDLLLLDELYFGAYLWKFRRPGFARLAAVAIDVDPQKFKDAEKKPRAVADRALKRSEPPTVSMMRALEIIAKAATAPDKESRKLIDMLGADAPDVEGLVQAMGPDSFAGLDLDQLACCCRAMHDLAAAGPGPARTAVTNVLDRLDEFSVDRAAAVFAGLLASVYFDGSQPRIRPASPILQDIFDWQRDSAVQFVLKALASKLAKVQSAVLYIPNPSAPKVKMSIKTDIGQHATPVLVEQVYFAGRALLADGMLQEDLLLRNALGKDQANLRQIAEVVSDHFGLPIGQLEIEGGDESDLRTIPGSLGFTEFDRFDNDVVPEEDFLPEGENSDVEADAVDDDGHYEDEDEE